MGGLADPFSIASVAVSEFDVEDRFIIGVLDEVFASMNRKDSLAAKLYIKYSIQQQVMEKAVLQDKGPEFFRRFVEDPDVVYIPYECPRCGHFDPRRKTKIREFLIARLTGKSLKCVQCRLTVKMDYSKVQVSETVQKS